MTPELLPCPFCGGTPYVCDNFNIGLESEGFWVQCRYLPCHVSGPLETTQEAAILHWNHRAPSWQPIETAPKDGRRILAYHASDKTFHVVKWNVVFGEWSISGGGVGNVTHWHPLPPAPEETA